MEGGESDAMRKQVLIAGGGVGGMAAALASSHAGWDVRLFERSPQFSEVGAGIQLGPNVVRRLQAWGLQRALQDVAAVPPWLRVRSAIDGDELACMELGAQMVERYGASYLAIHRADLHAVLQQEVVGRAEMHINNGQVVASVVQSHDAVTVTTEAGKVIEGDALIAADGVWSGLRVQLLHDGRPRPTGHLAYRALVKQSQLPKELRCDSVVTWLGPRMHVVQYPVRKGDLLNIVAIIEGPAPDDLQSWDHAANAAELERVLARYCAPLQDLIRAVPAAGVQWRLWPLSDRAPLTGPDQMAQGLVGLLGDAAHPMLPYLAQGAGMAIEDAAELQRALAMDDLEVHLRLRRYALNRWQRVARVQARSRRNARIFHASGTLRWGRDLSLRLLGARIMDMPWLYRGDGSSASSL